MYPLKKILTNGLVVLGLSIGLATSALANGFDTAKELADKGNPLAQIALGGMYRLGKNVDKDDVRAVFWYKKGASLENILGQSIQNTFEHVHKKNDNYERDSAELIIKYKKEASPENNSVQRALRLINIDETLDKKISNDFFYKVLDKESTLSHSGPRVMYLEEEAIKQDYANIIRKYQKVAEQGSISAQIALAEIYRYGIGVSSDDEKAAPWYEKAAKQGNAEAQRSLGWIYLEGRGVVENKTQARIWFQKSCDNGDYFGCDMLD